MGAEDRSYSIDQLDQGSKLEKQKKRVLKKIAKTEEKYNKGVIPKQVYYNLLTKYQDELIDIEVEMEEM
ncbi:MAG: hypothetical protein B6U72_03140 [Candidatus Altiarchaeales archaeon ex4484_2]|nr:MAG: hypothetical protein B6U72_03140 [Candidatus Altiarchaeales archaeon ex4484_2]